MVRSQESIRRDERLVVIGAERRERHRALLAYRTRDRSLGENAEEPAAKRRPTLEPVEAVQRRDPGLLRNLLGDRAAAHERDGDANHALVVTPHKRLEGGFVAVQNGDDDLHVAGHGLRCSRGRCSGSLEGRRGHVVTTPSSSLSNLAPAAWSTSCDSAGSARSATPNASENVGDGAMVSVRTLTGISARMASTAWWIHSPASGATRQAPTSTPRRRSTTTDSTPRGSCSYVYGRAIAVGRSMVAETTSSPAARASSSVRPTDATSGSV